jgi:RimJ/RimL family protein N-acetyltransferase
MPRFPVLVESDRLIIRPIDPDTAELVNAAIRDSYAALHTWMPWADHVPDVAETRRHLAAAEQRYLDGSDVALSLWLREGGQFVGGSGLHDRLGDPAWQEIGYWVRTSLTGRGLASEAVRAIAQVAFDQLGLTGLQIKTSERNMASQRVAERAGFMREALLDDGRIDPGGIPSRTVLFVRRRPEIDDCRSTADD